MVCQVRGQGRGTAFFRSHSANLRDETLCVDSLGWGTCMSIHYVCTLRFGLAGRDRVAPPNECWAR